VVNSATVSPDEFAVFVYVSVQQQTTWNSSHYKQTSTKMLLKRKGLGRKSLNIWLTTTHLQCWGKLLLKVMHYDI